MITKELKREVLKEVRKLKQHASEEELQKLDFDNLDPFSPICCIYGQMTGNCWSIRSIDLLGKCAITYSTGLFRKIEPDNKSSLFNRKVSNPVFSALEYYIARDEAQNQNIIDYLK